MNQKDVNSLMQPSPEYRQKANSCENCERLEARIKVLEGFVTDLLTAWGKGDYSMAVAVKNIRAKLEVK